MHLPISTRRLNATLHLVLTVDRECLCWLKHHYNRHVSNEVFHEFFDNLRKHVLKELV